MCSWQRFFVVVVFNLSALWVYLSTLSLVCKISAEKSISSLIWVPLYVMSHFSLAFFKSLCLYFWQIPYKLSWCRTLSSVQLLSHARLFATPWTTACQASLSITKSQSPPKPTSIETVMPSNHLIPSRPALNLSQHQGLFQRVSSSHQIAKYWSFWWPNNKLQHQSFQWIPSTYLL